MNKEKGFTLVELMMVTAIIGILAAVALPAYQDYTTRARVTEAFNLATTGKKGIQEYYKEYLRFPADNDSAGIPAPDKIIGSNVASVEVVDGAIHIKFQDSVSLAAGGSFLTLRPALVDGSPLSPMSWICGYQEPVSGMVAIGENRTDVRKNVLPSVCR